MPKLETPRSFVENNTGYGGKKFVQLMDAIEARDAQYLALLKTCGEALEVANKNCPPGGITEIKTGAALAALKGAGVL